MKIEEMMDLVYEVNEGKSDPIRAYIKLYEIEKMAGEFKKQIAGLAIEKRDMYNEKEYMVGNYNVSVVSTTRYSYKGDFEIERLQEKIKGRQLLMQQAYRSKAMGGELYDENGEQICPAEPQTTTYLKRDLKR